MRHIPFIVLLAVGAAARAAVVTYPGPGGVAGSDQYDVKVAQAGRSRDAFVYLSKAPWRSNRSKDTSWTTFSFSGKVTVEVTKRGPAPKACTVLPSRLGIRPVMEGNTARFTLDRPRKVSVEFDDPIPHPMLVFADPLEKNVPAPGDANVVYFGPGVHDVGLNYRIGRGKTVYLAGGAWVKGTFRADDATGTVIRGRGVLSGEQFGPKSHHLLTARSWNTRGCVVEGITLANSPHYNLRLWGQDNVVRNVKMISWWFSTDGVATGPNSLVENCFFKVNDDAIKLYFSGMKVRDCVIWQCENGAPFQISWNMPTSHRGFHVKNVDIIRCEHRWKNDNCAIFCSIHGGKGHMSDYLFEDIHIENAPWRLVNLVMKKTEFSSRQKGYGSISNVAFRNVTVAGPMKLPNTIAGHNRDHPIRNVLFENVRVNGRYWTDANSANLRIDPNSTSGIRFKVTR